MTRHRRVPCVTGATLRYPLRHNGLYAKNHRQTGAAGTLPVVCKIESHSFGSHTSGMKMIGKLKTLFSPDAARTDLGWHMDRFIELLDPAIKRLPDYRRTLEPATEFAHEYCLRLASALPGPYTMSESGYGADPLLSALFPRREDIPAAFGRSIEVRDKLPAFAHGTAGEVHALLGLRQRVTAAPPDTPPSLSRAWSKPRFVDHTLRSLATSEQEVRRQFAGAVFDSLRHGYLRRVEEQRRNQKRMHNERQLMLEVASVGGDPVAPPLTDVETCADADLSPAGLLAGLIAWLHTPFEHLRLEMGNEDAQVILPHPDPTQRGLQKLELPTLVGVDRRRWPICLVRFPYEEALAAVGRESMAHRYLLI